ncbi:MaoC family dehydratase [Bacteroidota bacterium]
MPEFEEGMSLPELIKVVSQEKINLYAEASRDFNPIHIDEEFAKKTPLGGTIAHGMMILAYISQMMADTFGHNWFSGGNLDIRFKSPARPGDTITVSGEIQRVEKIETQSLVRCAVGCYNQRGEPVIIGEATVRV